MTVALFLHLYQPPTQDPKVTLKITQRSYLKLIELLKKYKQARVTINLSGSLLEQWLTLSEKDSSNAWALSAGDTQMVQQVLNDFKALVATGQLELTATAMYHPLLPVLPSREVIRQIQLDQQLKDKVFGSRLRPNGFFPPEMVYTRNLAQIIEGFGFEWIILDESAHPLSTLRNETYKEHQALHLGDRIYQINRSRLKVFFRDREASLKVAFSNELSLKEFFASYCAVRPSNYLLLAMDGETFGHHRPKMLEWLEELFAKAERLATISELLRLDLPVNTIEPITSTWGVTIEEPDQARTFPRWQNPNNPVHKLQWELYNLALEVGEDVNNSKPNPRLARRLLDQGLHSDQFWWGSASPCWNLTMIGKGAALLRDSILLNPKSSQDERTKARNLYVQILQVGKERYGSQEVSC